MSSTFKPRECPGCGRPISFVKYACRDCWRLLPWHMQRAITDAWQAEDWTEHEEAKEVADEYLRQRLGRRQ